MYACELGGSFAGGRLFLAIYIYARPPPKIYCLHPFVCINFVLENNSKIRTKTKISEPSFEVLYETERTEVDAHLCLSARGTFCFLRLVFVNDNIFVVVVSNYAFFPYRWFKIQASCK